MAEVSLKIKADFEQAKAQFDKIDMSSESFQKSLAKLQKQMADGSIDKFMNRNQLAAAAMTAAKGSAAGLQTELAGLQRELQRLIKNGIDPLDPALNKMKTRMTEIQGQLPRTNSSLSSMGANMSAVAGVLAGSAIANKIFDIGKASLYAAGAAQENQIAFKTMLGSASQATNLLNEITQFAAKTPFQKDELIEYAKGMVGVGFATKDIIPTMEMLGNIAAGVGKEKLPNIVKAFDKMKAKGKASLEELWPIVEAGVPLLDQLANDLGKSKDEVIKMATAGKLSFEQVQSSLKKVELEKFNGLMNELTVTFGGKMSNLNDQLGMTAVIIGNKMMPAANTWLDLAGNILTKINSSGEETQSTFSKIVSEIGFMGSPLKTIFDYNTWIVSKANEYLFATENTADAVVSLTALIDKQRTSVKDLVDQFNKNPNGFGKDPKPKPAGSGQAKTEDQILQERLNNMAMSQEAYEMKRLNTMQSFYDQRVALQGSMNEEEMAEFLRIEDMKIQASNMTRDQKIAAMTAVNEAVRKNASAQLQAQVQFGAGMVTTASSMVADLQIVMKNAGKSSYGLAVALKALAIAEATVSSYLAYARVLATPMPWPMNQIAAGITVAAGLAKVAAIASTPIPSAQTGLSDYTVPDIRSNRNDGAAVMAQAGETVSVMPRGEDGGGLTNINISVSEQTIFSIVAKGIKSGQIDVNNKNIGRGVFAN